MQMIYCPNCGKLTGFKRSLGFGTFFMTLLTFGLWLLVIPAYPARCINCGLTRGSAIQENIISWFRRGNTRSKIIATIGVLILALLLFIVHTHTEPTAQNLISNSPDASNGPPTENLSTTTTPDKPQPGHTDHADLPPNAEDHELHLLPNLFGSGAVSDGRTYSVALISAYQSKIPPSTDLFVQGIIEGPLPEPYAISLRDEQDEQKTLICGMSEKEFQDVTFLYRLGSRVQAHGEYVNTSNGVPTLRNCQIADATDNVVRLGTVPATKTEPQTGEPIQGTQALSSSETPVHGDQILPDSVASLRKEAEQGGAVAQYNLGVSYEKGQGVDQDYVQAVYWYRKAAEQGYANAEYNLGGLCRNGQGVLQDYAQAAGWWRKAAEQGIANAQDGLGSLYFLGQGVAKDYVQAVYWYRKAAEQGYAKAQYNLGVSYYFGQGVDQDYVQAVYWYRKAAEQGYANAEYNLGVSYQKGQGVPKDDAQAADWYRKSAEQGHPNAQ